MSSAAGSVRDVNDVMAISSEVRDTFSAWSMSVT